MCLQVEFGADQPTASDAYCEAISAISVTAGLMQHCIDQVDFLAADKGCARPGSCSALLCEELRDPVLLWDKLGSLY